MSSEQELNEILADNTSGSTPLLARINDWLCRYYNYPPPLQTIKKIENCFYEFANIVNYLNELRENISKGSYSTFIADFSEKRKSSFIDLIKTSTNLLKNFTSFLTISNSETTLVVFQELYNHNNRVKVYVSESRPMFEGRVLAERLADSGISVTLFTEASLPHYIAEVDCVIIGADKVFPDGSIVNKTGSKLIAILARQYNKPLYVIADNSKFSKNVNFKQSIHPSEEIWKTDRENVDIQNYYFEKIDYKYITGIISNSY